MKENLLLIILMFCLNEALEQCREVEIEWQCEKEGGMVEPVRKNCSSSLDTALTVIEEQETVCEGRLSLNLTLFSQYESLSSYIKFTNYNFSQVSMTGVNSTVIQCKTGLASVKFDGAYKNTSYYMNVKIENLTFHSCGPGPHVFLPSAIFISLHCQIQISNIKIENSNGCGLAIVNVAGQVSITNSMFHGNVFEDGYGGGIHLTIMKPMKCTITNCTFKENRVVPKMRNDSLYTTQGGGLYVQFKSHSQNGNLRIEYCHFINNEAEKGCGMLAMFNDSSNNNQLFLYKSKFIDNCVDVSKYEVKMAGGGMAVTIFRNSSSNKVVIAACAFNGNTATTGGGLLIFSEPLQGEVGHITPIPNHLFISGCSFVNNRGHIGAAVHFYCTSPPGAPQHCNAEPQFEHNNISGNYGLSQESIPPGLSRSQRSIVHISQFPTVLKLTVEFYNNSGTPLYVHDTSVIVDEYTVVKFENNIAGNGGALTLYGSWITISRHCKLIFFNNTAVGFGGAIYAFMTEEVYLPYSHSCFIRSTQSGSPEHWETDFIFSGNTNQGIPNAIYATSVLPCVYDINYSEDTNIRDTFCKWNGWNFGNDTCNDMIRTSPRNFSSTLQNMWLYPGIPSDHLIYAEDDLGHNIDNLFVYPLVINPKHGELAHINNRILTVYGNIETNVTIELQLLDDRQLSITVNVYLKICPPAFEFNSDSRSCICQYRKYIKCGYNNSRNVAKLAAGYCVSYSSTSYHYDKSIMFGQCPFTIDLYDNNSHPILFYPLPVEKELLNIKFCGKLNRTGTLCGDCVANHSIDMLSSTFRCFKCSGSLKNWLIYLTAEGVLPLIFFSVVLILHISFTNGPLNGFIFFSQVITVPTEIIWFQASWTHTSFKKSYYLTGFTIMIYSIWSLDFLRFAHGYYHLCLGSNLKVMHVLVLRYLSVIYPLCFLIVAFIVIELHARNCRLLVWLWKPLCFLCARFRQAWKARTSIVDAFAAFLLLSYVKLVRISILLVTHTTITVEGSHETIKVMNYDPTVRYLSSEHIPFWLIAGVLLLTFGLVPPLLLTFYQFKCFQRILNKYRLNGNGLRIFMDAFQGCYKDGRDGGPDRRYYAGFYFIFRLVVFYIFDTTVSTSYAFLELLTCFVVFGVITAVLRPYKVPFFTYLDVVLFNLLAIIMALQNVSFFIAVESYSVPIPLLSITFVLIIIPFIYLCLFVVFWISGRAPKCVRRKVLHSIRLVRLANLKKSRYSRANNYSILDEVSDSLPDRLEHSSRYKSL